MWEQAWALLQAARAAVGGHDELKTMREFVRPGDVLAVVKVDRIGRNTRDVLNLVHELEQKDGHLRVLEPAIDTSGPMGKMVLTVLGTVAEMELSFIKERQRAGIEAAKAKGVYKGRPVTLDNDKAIQLKRKGKGATEIAKAFKCSRRSVYWSTRSSRLHWANHYRDHHAPLRPRAKFESRVVWEDLPSCSPKGRRQVKSRRSCVLVSSTRASKPDLFRSPKSFAEVSSAHWLNTIGLALGKIGVVVIFIWGAPMPEFQSMMCGALVALGIDFINVDGDYTDCWVHMMAVSGRWKPSTSPRGCL